MNRYLVIKGKPGVLVLDPTATGRRYLGQQRKPGSSSERRLENYEPCIQVVSFHSELLKPWKTGQFDVIGGKEVMAPSRDAALAQATKQAPAPQKDNR